MIRLAAQKRRRQVRCNGNQPLAKDFVKDLPAFPMYSSYKRNYREDSHVWITTGIGRSGSGCKKPCLDVERPAPLQIQNYKFHKELGKGNFGQVQAFLVLEYACGRLLANMISKSGKLPTETIQFYTAEIVIGLQFLHSNGIVHRLITSWWIGVDTLKSATSVSDEGLFDKKIICGLAATPGYRAPEVLLMEYYNAGADWWSLGVIIYEMATAKQPFSPSVSAMREFMSIKTPQYPSYMSQEMQDLLSKLLEMDRKQRLGVNGNIREHPFFATINWENLEKIRVKTPFQPKMPFTSELRVISPGLSADTSKRERVEELSYMDPTWHWQD
ncbi:hypothetical protein XELAEV_18011876mg [Xenopus laevis]|uniref:Protein kinase domain-containing protein n=1 Tax=Xenopus laevis TaxID=8355 RepID=A0A974DM50_XENLA|nr:hypothetical protein XELAEV_18011876mg [Xenopus laevis]